MNFILNASAREAVIAFGTAGFSARTILPDRALVLAVSGCLGKIDSSTLSPATLRHVCTNMTLRMSSVLLLNIEEHYASGADTCAMMLSVTHLPVDTAPYANLHALEIVQLVDPEALLEVVRACRNTNKHLSQLVPFMSFYRVAAAKLSREMDIMRAVLYNPAMSTVLGEAGTVEFFSKLFDMVPDDDVEEVYKFCVVPADVLLRMHSERGILPSNHGLSSVTDLAVMLPILRTFMQHPEIDFKPFVNIEVMHTKEAVNIILEHLCVHRARWAIREALLFSMTYAHIVQRVGIRAHACIGTPDEIFPYRCPATRLTMASVRELKFVIDNAGVYCRVMKLEDDLRGRIQELDELWHYNAGVCMATFPEAPESTWMRALQSARMLVSGAQTVTPEMLDVIVERGLFDYAILYPAVGVERVVPYASKVLRIEDALAEPYVRLLYNVDMRKAFCALFVDNSMYMGVIIASTLQAELKMELLSMVPPNRMPMTRLEAALNTAAYAWSPRDPVSAVIRSSPAEHVFMDANPYVMNYFVANNRVRVETGTHVRKYMQVIGFSQMHPNTGLLSIRESNHALVRVCVGGVTMVGMQYVCATHTLPSPETHCVNVLTDFMVLLKYGLVYRVMTFPALSLINFSDLDLASLLRTSPVSFAWHEFVTLNDEILEYSPIFALGNHYIERARILCCYALQYFIHALCQWRDIFSSIHLPEFVKNLYAIITHGSEMRISEAQLECACVELSHAIHSSIDCAIPHADMFVADMLAAFALSVLPECHAHK